MTQLSWGDVGERFYEAGLDRGVLYIDTEAGVAWNGLISVTEESSGGDAVPYYMDGVKYLDRVSTEEFAATIEAYTYPDEFAQCDGTALINNGLFATQQLRKDFGLSYRTKIGNDVDGVDHGYKIHLVYNATTTPSQKTNNTLSDSSDPANFSWPITTKPSLLTAYSPTSHFVVDSRTTPETLLTDLENILYGSEGTDSRLPTSSELVDLFLQLDILLVDSGEPTTVPTGFYDGGFVDSIQTGILDGGTITASLYTDEYTEEY